VTSRGDTERQAFLRDRMAESGEELNTSRYVSRVKDLLRKKIGMRVLDIGCGTAHIIGSLAISERSATLVGLDISSAMLRAAKANTCELTNVILIQGDGLTIPFSNQSFDLAITRLAEYSHDEAFRVTRVGGTLLECGLGPDADKEIAECFGERIDRENFFFPRRRHRWMEEVSENVEKAGFHVEAIHEYTEKDTYRSEEELMDLIEMVPLVTDFDRESDREIVSAISRKYGDRNGIRITWHYYVLEASRPARSTVVP